MLVPGPPRRRALYDQEAKLSSRPTRASRHRHFPTGGTPDWARMLVHATGTSISVTRSLNRFLYTQCKKAAYDMRPSNIQYWGLGHYNVPRVQSIVALVGLGWFLVLVIEPWCLRRRSELCGGFRGAAPGARAGRPRLTSVTRSLNPSAGGRARLRLIRRQHGWLKQRPI